MYIDVPRYKTSMTPSVHVTTTYLRNAFNGYNCEHVDLLSILGTDFDSNDIEFSFNGRIFERCSGGGEE